MRGIRDVLRGIGSSLVEGLRFHCAYFKAIRRRAWRETRDHVGWNRPTLVVSLLSVFVTLAFRLRFEGPDKMSESLGWEAVYVIATLVVVSIIVFFVNLLRAPAILHAEIEKQRDELDRSLRSVNDKQGRVDALSRLLSEGIHNIWNAPVNDDNQLSTLKVYWVDWHQRVLSYLNDNFNQADVDHFDRLGVVPITMRDNTYQGSGSTNGQHATLLTRYALQEQRLREIIRDHNVTHIYLQYSPIISTSR